MLKGNLYIAKNLVDVGDHPDPRLARPAEMSPIMELAHSHALKVIENSLQALGTTYLGRIPARLAMAVW